MRLRKWESANDYTNLKVNMGTNRKWKLMHALQHGGNEVEKVNMGASITDIETTESEHWCVFCNMKAMLLRNEKVKVIMKIRKWTWGLTESDSWCVPCNMEVMRLRKLICSNTKNVNNRNWKLMCILQHEGNAVENWESDYENLKMNMGANRKWKLMCAL